MDGKQGKYLGSRSPRLVLKVSRKHYGCFLAAAELGVDQIETDVRVTRDGELVLMHDAKVDRTTNGQGLICEMTLNELQALDAGNGERIPALRDLLS